MSHLKKLIVGLIICIIIILLLIIKILKEGEEKVIDENQFTNNISQGSISDENVKTFEKINDYDVLCTLKSILSNYITNFEYVNSEQNIEGIREEISEEELIQQQREQGMAAIIDIFDEDYKKDITVTNDSIVRFVGEYKINNNQGYNIDITNMYTIDMSNDISIVLINSAINEKNFNCIIKLDSSNNTYSMFWEDYITKYSISKDTKIDDIKINVGTIEKNEYNTFQTLSANVQTVVMQYFLDYKNKVLTNPSKAYELIETNYKEKRFATYQLFEEYINDMKDTIQYASVSKYEKKENEIFILDNYNNVYIFNLIDLINYNIQLDDYTIETEDFVQSYNSASEQEKVKTDIQKFFKMINSRDYNSAYNLLDDSFKQNNFDTIEKFKQYAQQHFLNWKITGTKNFEKSGSYYICIIETTLGEEENSQKSEETFIVDLREGTDFAMSFTMK